MRRIVVGVDGSERSLLALRWAVDEARLRGAEVEAIHAWTYPVVGGLPVTPVMVDLEGIERDARQVLDESVAKVDAGDVAVEGVLVRGGAAHALIDRAQGADLLVVGSRGLGGFTGLLLGSVSQQVVHHAPCPVVVIPPDE
jgi:nucleotide-binding universal stress UspA family protein